jgi:hypothetical protein
VVEARLPKSGFAGVAWDDGAVVAAAPPPNREPDVVELAWFPAPNRPPEAAGLAAAAALPPKRPPLVAGCEDELFPPNKPPAAGVAAGVVEVFPNRPPDPAVVVGVEPKIPPVDDGVLVGVAPNSPPGLAPLWAPPKSEDEPAVGVDVVPAGWPNENPPVVGADVVGLAWLPELGVELGAPKLNDIASDAGNEPGREVKLQYRDETRQWKQRHVLMLNPSRDGSRCDVGRVDGFGRLREWQTGPSCIGSAS